MRTAAKQLGKTPHVAKNTVSSVTRRCVVRVRRTRIAKQRHGWVWWCANVRCTGGGSVCTSGALGGDSRNQRVVVVDMDAVGGVGAATNNVPHDVLEQILHKRQRRQPHHDDAADGAPVQAVGGQAVHRKI